VDEIAVRKIQRQLKKRLEILKNAGIEVIPAAACSTSQLISPAGASDRPPEPPGTSAPAPLGSPIVIPPQSSLYDQPSDVPRSVEGRRKALDLMAVEISSCDRCPELYSTRTQTVFGVGPISPEICFVGEAPGADEDRLGEPFVGAAGQLLNKIIAAMGMRREEVYICNTLKCRPPNNRTPYPQEVGNCRGYFEHQLDLIQPKFICCLGGVAAQNVLGTKIGITKLRGRFYEYRGVPVLCTFHPAFLLRNPAVKRDVWNDMQLLLKTMGRPVPRAGGVA
jgi:DNA polymerase